MSNVTQIHFKRPSLASHLTQALMGKIPFNDSPNGLFLAAPRRIGKSAFLQQDLRPALQEAGVVVIYLDLWVNRDKDPLLVIAQAIGAELNNHLGIVSKAAKAIGLESVSIAGVLKFDTKKIGQPDGVTLTDALSELIKKSKKSVALIIDEAQHALTSKSGESAMMALKSARDTINNSGGKSLMLVMSGSDRDKLMRLVNTNSSAFYGSYIQKMPPLDIEYIKYTVKQIEDAYPLLVPVDINKIDQAFKLLGNRPQFLANAIAQGFNPFEFAGLRIEDAVLKIANNQINSDRDQMESDFIGLKDLEKSIIWRMLEMGDKFRPYDGDALNFYSSQTGGQMVTPQQVQSALTNLRARDPVIIWKSERGDYSLDNSQMRDWYLELLSNNNWPPSNYSGDFTESSEIIEKSEVIERQRG